MSSALPLTRPLAAYQHIRRVGSVVFVAGQGCRDPLTNEYRGLTLGTNGEVISYDITEQTLGVLQNIEKALHSIGLTRSAIADVQVFLTNMQDFEKMNAVWNRFFKDLEPPTRTTVAVAGLPGKNFIEMKAVAQISMGI